MIKGGLSAFEGKRVLLLQGPLGPFFGRLAEDLRHAGAVVWKIDFNGGDCLYSKFQSIRFRGQEHEWPDFFRSVVKDKQIDTVLLFGDCRPMHRVAHEVAGQMGLKVGVFEEGYVRPDYITLEQHGVNAHSRIPRDPDFYQYMAPVETPPTRWVGNMFWHAVLWAVTYYLASILLSPMFRHYRHHRPLNAGEFMPWVRSAWRKIYFRRLERHVQTQLVEHHSRRFYLVPLQVHNDAQIHIHSDFTSVEQFIGHVIASYALHAPKDTLLVIKHHPMDRGYHNYTEIIRWQAELLGIGERVLYIHDQNLPTLLDHACGVVLINSTVGLSALHHGTPLKTCGQAIYDMKGMTYQGQLDDFWQDAPDFRVNATLYRRFLGYLISNTQINGSFYRRLALPNSLTGLVWDKEAGQEPVPEDAMVEGGQYNI